MIAFQITYLFLYLIPALLECLAVSFVFLVKFKLWSLSLIALAGVSVYIAVTIAITLWRKKFRLIWTDKERDFHLGH